MNTHKPKLALGGYDQVNRVFQVHIADRPRDKMFLGMASTAFDPVDLGDLPDTLDKLLWEEMQDEEEIANRINKFRSKRGSQPNDKELQRMRIAAENYKTDQINLGYRDEETRCVRRPPRRQR